MSDDRLDPEALDPEATMRRGMRHGGLEPAGSLRTAVELPESGPCPDPMDLAAYVEGTGEAHWRDSIEMHLACCDGCRCALAHARGVGDMDSPRAERFAVRWVRGAVHGAGGWSVAAAAALLAFVAGSASTWWMGSSDMSLPPMATDVARLSPSGAPMDSSPMSITRGITLTPTQDAALQAIRERDSARFAGFHERLEAINAALALELEASEPDRTKVGALVQERYEILGQRLRLEAGQVRDFCTMLTPDQCARLGRAWLGRHGHGSRMRGSGATRPQASPTLTVP
jgi:Spy/CpxP family protein refolding chaperone